ncbi:MAG: prepilin-type N-terminal cleavage/methylation domain-containing protein [Candidatus Kuenenbacteria bacterium]
MRNKPNQKGMTLVETTIALGILMIGIMASITLMLSTFNFAQKNEQEIIVVNLAREGIEIVRALRNNQSANLFDGTYDGRNYIVDVDENFNLDNEMIGIDNINECNACLLKLINGQYSHGAGGQNTNIKRMISIKNVSSNEKKILSEVSWMYKGTTYDFILESNLTNWTNELENIKLFY